MALTQFENVEVSVLAGVDGAERIALSIGDQGSTMKLTPAQARLLATELIAAVNRAEVKASLKVGNNMWRRPNEPSTRLASAS